MPQNELLRRVGSRLATCRSKGYTEGNNELEVGLRSIAVPIFNRKGETIAAMNISTNMMRSSEKQIAETLLPVLLKGVKKLNQQTGYQLAIDFLVVLKSHTFECKIKENPATYCWILLLISTLVTFGISH